MLKLYPFQLEGVEFLKSRKVGLLADDMGLGKTAQAITAIKELKALKVLIVCPASIKYNWKFEFSLWGLGARSIQIVEGRFATISSKAEIVIINYELLSSPKIFHQLTALTFSVGVFDESHYMKNRNAKRTKAVLLRGGIASRCVYKWFLTGTPVLNRPIELYPLLKATRPDVIYPFTSYSAFARRYCSAFFDGYVYNDRGASNIPELAGKLKASGFMLRRLKSEVLKDLPEKQFQILPVKLNAKNKAYYEEKNFTFSKDEVKRMKFSDICGGDMGAVAKLRHLIAIDKLPTIKAHLIDLFEVKDKVVVFAHHRSVIYTLMSEFARMQPVVIMGGIRAKQKFSEVQRFQTDPNCRLFIGEITSVVGITLTAADIAVFAEIDWVPGNIFQAVDRIHRIGQDRGVLIQFFVVENSLEEYMLQTVVFKKHTIEELIGDNERGNGLPGSELFL